MDEGDVPIGAPITLAELKSLGRFVRWQELAGRVAELTAEQELPNGYPLVASRLPADGIIDLSLGGHWRQVEFVRLEGSRMRGDRRIVYRDQGTEKSTPYDWYSVAPQGYYTAWADQRPENLAGAALTERFQPAQPSHRIYTQELVDEDWPYLTFKADSADPRARFVDRMWTGSYTIHAADPRVNVPGVVPREPWFNTAIAVSHRWLGHHHPDPDGVQFSELLRLSATLGLADTQTFLLDYCSLPQSPRTPHEERLFRDHLPGFQGQFKYVTVVLNTGSDDYATRAWCMLELMLTAMAPAPRPTLLNHEHLDSPLSAAVKQAQAYVRHGVWHQQSLAKALQGRSDSEGFRAWSRDLTNVALYNERIEYQQSIFEKFESELAVTDPNDRPIIIDLLRRLAFQESGTEQ
jgi:hypothetical protein